MQVLIILFSLLIILMAGALLFKSKEMTEFLLKNSGRNWMQVVAAAVRIVIGILLVLYAPQSRFPLALQVIGWLAVAAGVVIALIPPSKFQRMIHWVFERFGRYTRWAALGAVLFGGFLIYAVT